jgi:hypothetical protein
MITSLINDKPLPHDQTNYVDNDNLWEEAGEKGKKVYMRINKRKPWFRVSRLEESPSPRFGGWWFSAEK